MTHVPFYKYTSFGNNFVVLDEVNHRVLSESDKPRFGYHATNPYFGVGCDNLLALQACSREVLEGINAANRYWDRLPDPGLADFVFRMFEPDGEEALSCGNGLLSLARHLADEHGIKSARIMTQVPLESPRVITIGTDEAEGAHWANLGVARRIPASLASESCRVPVDSQVDRVKEVEFNYRSHDLRAYTEGTSLAMTAYAVFTGEPHLVIFPDDSFSNLALAEMLFGRPATGRPTHSRLLQRKSVGSWLVRRIGGYLNDHYEEQFPHGVSVNFARLEPDGQTTEYRCYERGINRETLACGTGAVAVACVASSLGLITGDALRVLPHRCRWHDRNAEIFVTCGPDSTWCLNGIPRRLFSGQFELPDNAAVPLPATGTGSESFATMDLEPHSLTSTGTITGSWHR